MLFPPRWEAETLTPQPLPYGDAIPCRMTGVSLRSHVRYKEIKTPVLLSEDLLAHDVYVCLERPSEALSSLKLSDTTVYEPEIRALLGTAAHFCEVVFKLRTVTQECL